MEQLAQYGVAGLALGLGLYLTKLLDRMLERRNTDREPAEPAVLTASVQEIKRRLDEIQRDVRAITEETKKEFKNLGVLEYRVKAMEERLDALEGGVRG